MESLKAALFAWLVLNRLRRVDLMVAPGRDSDPWEILSTIIKEVFKTEITVSPYNEAYHTYIKLTTYKGDFNERGLFTRYSNYTPRDLTAEGSGF